MLPIRFPGLARHSKSKVLTIHYLAKSLKGLALKQVLLARDAQSRRIAPLQMPLGIN